MFDKFHWTFSQPNDELYAFFHNCLTNICSLLIKFTILYWKHLTKFTTFFHNCLMKFAIAFNVYLTKYTINFWNWLTKFLFFFFCNELKKFTIFSKTNWLKSWLLSTIFWRNLHMGDSEFEKNLKFTGNFFKKVVWGIMF